MNIEFPGKTAIVTGGAHGFGRAIAHAFAERGARTWTCDILAEGLDETAAQARPAAGGGLDIAVVDVTDRAAVARFVDRVIQATGRIDIVVNNAGGVCGQVGQPIEDVTEAAWQVIFDVNVNGSFHFAQAVAPHMKAAQIGLTRQLAHELGPFGITVNNIAPGFVRSNPTTERQWQSYGAEGQQRLVERIALRRLGSPADIAHAVLFFASDYAAWITGQVLSVNGG